jgi:hypothetical protein
MVHGAEGMGWSAMCTTARARGRDENDISVSKYLIFDVLSVFKYLNRIFIMLSVLIISNYILSDTVNVIRTKI